MPSQLRAGPSSEPRLKPSDVLDLAAGLDAVARRVPVPDRMPGADERQRLLLGVADQALRERAAGEGVLHDGEGDQHHDQHQSAGERRLHDGMVDAAGDGEPCREHPEEQDDPGRDQHDRAVEAR